MQKKHNEPTLAPPDLPEIAELTVCANSALTPQERYERAQFIGGEFDDSNATGMAIVESMLTKIAARNAKWLDLRLKDARLTNCDLANADWLGANLLRVELIDCRLTGASLSEAKYVDVRFVGCK